MAKKYFFSSRIQQIQHQKVVSKYIEPFTSDLVPNTITYTGSNWIKSYQDLWSMYHISYINKHLLSTILALVSQLAHIAGMLGLWLGSMGISQPEEVTIERGFYPASI